MLTAEQQQARRDITASFLPALMAGNDAAIEREWMRLVGHPDYVAADFSKNWPVYRGIVMETPVLDWHEKKTGEPLLRRGEVVHHPTLEYFSCTLDAWRAADDTVIDCKVVNGHWKLDEIEAYYTPQVIAQMRCTGAANGALLIEHGGAEPVELTIYVDPDYETRLWARVAQFWRCVATLIPPLPLRHVMPPARWRTVNLDNESDRRAHNWAQPMIDQLFLWSVREPAAKEFESAKEKVKELLPADVGLVTCSGLAVRRARNNAVTIRHTKEANHE